MRHAPPERPSQHRLSLQSAAAGQPLRPTPLLPQRLDRCTQLHRHLGAGWHRQAVPRPRPPQPVPLHSHAEVQVDSASNSTSLQQVHDEVVHMHCGSGLAPSSSQHPPCVASCIACVTPESALSTAARLAAGSLCARCTACTLHEWWAHIQHHRIKTVAGVTCSCFSAPAHHDRHTAGGCLPA